MDEYTLFEKDIDHYESSIDSPWIKKWICNSIRRTDYSVKNTTLSRRAINYMEENLLDRKIKYEYLKLVSTHSTGLEIWRSKDGTTK